jgi:hypothetical protein
LPQRSPDPGLLAPWAQVKQYAPGNQLRIWLESKQALLHQEAGQMLLLLLLGAYLPMNTTT